MTHAEAKATERPWRIGPVVHRGCVRIRDAKGYTVADDVAVDTAELIVRAVNAYDPALQSKLDQAVKALEEAQDGFAYLSTECDRLSRVECVSPGERRTYLALKSISDKHLTAIQSAKVKL